MGRLRETTRNLPKFLFYGLDLFELWKELTRRAFDPAVKCVRREWAAETRAFHADLERFSVKGNHLDCAAVIVFNIRAERINQRAHPFFVARGARRWRFFGIRVG
jgi:predicted solute-binding protein